MVDLGKFESAVLKGKIVEVKEMSLRSYLEERHGAKAPKIIEKFNPDNLDRDHVIVIVESDGAHVDWFGMIPKVQGYSRSNLSKVKQRNDLPNDTKKWVGKEVDLRVDNSGFLRVAV